MSKAETFLDYLGKRIPQHVLLHNTTGAPMIFHHNNQHIMAQELILQNGEILAVNKKPEARTACWDTFEANAEAVVSYLDTVQAVCGLVPLIITIREGKMEVSDSRGGFKRRTFIWIGVMPITHFSEPIVS